MQYAAVTALPFHDPHRTAKGEERAWVGLERLETLWINTGTLCNLSCPRCYIESSPRNDRLAYLTATEVVRYVDEAVGMGVRCIGFTGGEPFLNRDLGVMIGDALERGLEVLVLTNAQAPMSHARPWLQRLNSDHPGKLTLRVSLDHYAADLHDAERGAGAFAKGVDGLIWLLDHEFAVQVAGRTFCGKPDTALRAGFATLFRQHDLALDAFDPTQLIIFPEMDETVPVPEITTRCWGILGKAPSSVMCAQSRMVVKRKGAARPVVLPCTLLPYDPRFEMGETLAESARPVPLNHPHCAKFCVLGGASCSG